MKQIASSLPPQAFLIVVLNLLGVERRPRVEEIFFVSLPPVLKGSCPQLVDVSPPSGLKYVALMKSNLAPSGPLTVTSPFSP